MNTSAQPLVVSSDNTSWKLSANQMITKIILFNINKHAELLNCNYQWADSLLTRTEEEIFKAIIEVFEDQNVPSTNFKLKNKQFREVNL